MPPGMAVPSKSANAIKYANSRMPPEEQERSAADWSCCSVIEIRPWRIVD
jgi:hypothetical protein